MWNGKRFHSFDFDCKERFGSKVYKLSLDAGFTCPNRDGSIDTRGCIFCSAGGSGDFAAPRTLSVTEQIAAAKARVAAKNPSGRYIAYFQAFTNTYAPVDILKAKYLEAVRHPDVVALSIATRPDCLPNEVIDLLREISLIKPVTVELGLQTIHPQSAAWIRRGYPLEVYRDAVCRLDCAGLDIVTHLILGIPGETPEDMTESVKYVSSLPLTGIKLQLLHILKGTDLAEHFALYPEAYPLLDLNSYVNTLLSCLAVLPEHITVHRLTGDGPKDLLLAPKWSSNKKLVLNTIEREMKARSFLQGCALTIS